MTPQRESRSKHGEDDERRSKDPDFGAWIVVIGLAIGLALIASTAEAVAQEH